MDTTRVKIDKHGRLLFPLKIRKELNIKTGDIFVMRIIDGEITLLNLDQVVEKMQKLFRDKNPNAKNVVEDFLESRRGEYKLELEKEKRWIKKV